MDKQAFVGEYEVAGAFSVSLNQDFDYHHFFCHLRAKSYLVS